MQTSDAQSMQRNSAAYDFDKRDLAWYVDMFVRVLVFLGGIICIIGFFIFFFGAGKKVVSAGGQGASAVAGAAKTAVGKKSGSGTL